MGDDRPTTGIGRRELLGLWGPVALAGAALTALGAGLGGRAGRHRPPVDDRVPRPPDWRTDPAAPGRLAVAGGAGPRANLGRALAALGGIELFVRPGDRVAVKPNCAWDRSPEQAANTDPELVGEIARLCLAAGAASVVVVDNSCHDPARAFARSGIAEAARAAGATVAHQRSAGTVTLDLGGSVLGPWEVLAPIAGADRVINVPVVKHHSLGRATLGMKNWFGAIVGRRASLHQRIDQVCAELGAAFRPTLTVVDATRVLTGGGPTGGSLDLVRPDDLVAVSTDPVAADAWGATRLGLSPAELPYLAVAQRLGLGATDWQSVVEMV
ncbi:MAG: DUF362 domain-containing protein [Thermoanaerobaculales bacterium]|jgi:uncharacterized protein (DUF362 family)|nr:DUF362 domain-containing protein [Thermoanaerobaculales bacterium]